MTEKKSVSLLPCPFCGRVPRLCGIGNFDDNAEVEWDFACGTIGCYLEFGNEFWGVWAKERAIEMWNTRPGNQKEGGEQE